MAGSGYVDMYLIASFDQNIFIELAISALEKGQVPKGHILAIPLDKRREERTLFDSIHRADGLSMFDIAAVLGTCGMLLGAVYGFLLTWGPILWGLIGLLGGTFIGFLWKFLLVRQRIRLGGRRRGTEVFLMVYCDERDARWIEDILWDNTALGVARLGGDGRKGVYGHSQRSVR